MSKPSPWNNLTQEFNDLQPESPIKNDQLKNTHNIDKQNVELQIKDDANIFLSTSPLTENILNTELPANHNDLSSNMNLNAHDDSISNAQSLINDWTVELSPKSDQSAGEPSINIQETPEWSPSKKLKTIKLSNVDSSDTLVSNANNVDLQQSVDAKTVIENNIMGSKLENYETTNFDVDAAKIILNETQIGIQTDLTKPINDAANIQIRTNVGIQEISEKQKLKQLQKDKYKKLPKFLRFEYKHALTYLILNTIMLVSGLASIGVASYFIFAMGQSLNWYIPVVIFSIIGLVGFSIGLMKFNYLRRDMKMQNYIFDSENVMVSIKKIYRSLITANINLNWLSGSFYILAGFSILLTYIVTYFINVNSLYNNDFTYLIIKGVDYSPVYCVWSFVGVSGFILLIQLVYNLLNRKRKMDIELYFQKPIIDEELQLKYRKSANIRGLVIFIIATILVSFIAVITYLFLRKKRISSI